MHIISNFSSDWLQKAVCATVLFVNLLLAIVFVIVQHGVFVVHFLLIYYVLSLTVLT